jgi:gamma-glutamyltranspeptidase/glutathione hydrolase
MLRQPELAKTLHAIARSGPNAFYRGKIARSIVDEVQKSRGTLRLSDLQRYKPVYRTPISGGFVGFTIYGAPPPSSGGLTNQIMLNLYQSFQADYPALSPKDLELRTEILRSGFYLRNTYLGDPNFVSIPTHTLLSPDLTEKLRKKILDLPQNRSFSKLSTFGDNGGTTHFCVVDGERNVVSSTQSINYYFGSLLMAKDTGVILNNTMNDFATGTSNLFELKDGSPNSIEGGKTPLSSMSPTLVYRNDRLLLSLGSPGGPKIISAVWNVLLNRLYHNFPLPEAVAAPRVHHQGQPASLFHDGIGVGLTPRLVNSPFPLRHTPYGIGNVSAIELLESGSYLGVTDPRREGLATGVLQ